MMRVGAQGPAPLHSHLFGWASNGITAGPIASGAAVNRLYGSEAASSVVLEQSRHL
ncbi:hypothetical protein CWRG_02829 [Chthonomonas calidirosea]|uniref:hypothetical protein n=1 Tax=Chthonomonas calidirosea TaxID=454171 RepID=UPI0006DD52BB|nr:hypothetical protein [Chthonomonas calidirosea]CEK20424.1 hypothetical protein CWRG_02829 [Chthonomonas calidirosea]